MIVLSILRNNFQYKNQYMALYAGYVEWYLLYVKWVEFNLTAA